MSGIRYSNTYELKDGRILGFAEYGDPRGYPVFLLHGTPGSRLWFTNDDPISTSLGLRLIATDRPGYGLSSPKRNSTILEYSEDLAQLAIHLSFVNFSVIGVSGGGAYALASAYQLKQQVDCAVLCASIMEFEEKRPPKTMGKTNRIHFTVANSIPWIYRLMLRIERKRIWTGPKKYHKKLQTQLGHLCLSDQNLMKQDKVTAELYKHLKEAFRNGSSQVVQEIRLLSGTWGVKPEEIHCPILVWHGEEDTLAPIAPVKAFVAKNLNCRPYYIQNKGHFLTDEKVLWYEMLSRLVATLERPRDSDKLTPQRI